MNRLNYWIGLIEDKIKEIDPSSIIEVTEETYEGEDAYVRITSKLPRQEILKHVIPFTRGAIRENYFIAILTQKMESERPVAN